MMIQNYFTFLFYLLLSIQVHQVSSFRELDDANSRHPVGQPSYDVDNPPPTAKPSMVPSMQPSLRPSSFPSSYPSLIPTLLPTKTPSMTPSLKPSTEPSMRPSTEPSSYPSKLPSHQLSQLPTTSPSVKPSLKPSVIPSTQPSKLPSFHPSTNPTHQPSNSPSAIPSKIPSMTPSFHPSSLPSFKPSKLPSQQPSGIPTTNPSSIPSLKPSFKPSTHPSKLPSLYPSTIPSHQPSRVPTSSPSLFSSTRPSTHPSTHPSFYPSFTPSTSPSHQPSIYTCKTNANGEFGNTTGVAKERVSFRYELILNTDELNTHPDNYTNVTKTTILPLIENGMMDLLFPYIFTECIDENSNSTNTTSFANIEGISRVPEDIIVIAACNGETSGNNTCFPVDAEFSIYFKSRRRLAEDRQEMKQMKQIIQTAMMENQLISVHPAIVGMIYIETDNQPVIDPNRQEGLERIQSNDRTLWWKIVLGIGGVGLFVALIMLVWRKRKDRDEGESSEVSAVSSVTNS